MTTEKMEEVWKQTPPDILELIADFADIDTRRALCFKPRKLLLPALNINFNSYISNVHWINPSYSIDLGERVRVEFHPTYTAWEFYDGERDNSRHKFYQFSYVHKEITGPGENNGLYCCMHPDFNKDGTFKRDRITI